MSVRWLVGLTACTAFVLVPPVAAAQSSTTGAIAGVVRDASGAVIPGVTVEASSPALIEKVRVVVTDAEGLYRIVELRPGTYAVTFTLPGFTTVRREGIVLNAGVTAPLNADLQVGSVTETLTVSGQSPVVDVQNVRSQQVLTQEVLETIPVARTPQGYATLTLGVTSGNRNGSSGPTSARDVGGNQPDGYFGFSVNGAPADGKLTVDGVPTHNVMGDGTIRQFQINQLAVEEVALETSGMSAESPTGGVQIRVISKDGGNQFSANIMGAYTDENFQTGNLNDALRKRGLTQTNTTKRIYDIGGAVGGPIVRDRLWFYGAQRWWKTEQLLAGVYYNKIPETLFYEPDLSRPADKHNRYRDTTVRGTWQATSKDKVTGWLKFSENVDFITGASAVRTPEGTYTPFVTPTAQQITWTRPVSSRFLLDAGIQHLVMGLINKPIEHAGVSVSGRPVLEQTLGLNYGSTFSGAVPNAGARTTPPWIGDTGDHGDPVVYSARFAASYVTGSHAFKVGLSNVWGTSESGGAPLFTERYIFRNRVPVALTQLAAPNEELTRLKADLGLYVQDQWTIRRMTLNLGVRFDYLNAYVPDQVRPGGFYLPETSIARVNNVPNWKDMTPRLGVAYDLFGDGRTALRASLGKYLGSEATSIAIASSGSAALTVFTNRTWNDANGNYVPDCDLKNRAANGECGQIADSAFGSNRVTTRYDEAVTNGWGLRPYNWQGSVTVQHELRRNFGLAGGYYRTSYGNLTVVDNLDLRPSDYTEYCVTAPTDSRLPVSGQQLCGLYDINPDKFGLVNNLITSASRFGDQRKSYDGFQASVNMRTDRGEYLFGGVSSGRTVDDGCFAVDVPARPGYCREVTPMSGQTQVKFAGMYPLPWGLRASATFQNLPGIEQQASLTYTSAQIEPSLGRTLGQCRGAAVCTGTATVQLLERNTLRESRQSQLDIRFGRIFRVGGGRLVANLDIYNVFNAADVLSLVSTYGPNWLRPGTVLAGRLVKFGGQFTF